MSAKKSRLRFSLTCIVTEYNNNNNNNINNNDDIYAFQLMTSWVRAGQVLSLQSMPRPGSAALEKQP